MCSEGTENKTLEVPNPSLPGALGSFPPSPQCQLAEATEIEGLEAVAFGDPQEVVGVGLMDGVGRASLVRPWQLAQAWSSRPGILWPGQYPGAPLP